MIKKGLWIISMILVLCISLTNAQRITGRGQLTGVVYDAETKEPLEGVTVKLFCVPANKARTPNEITDSEGRWSALYLRGGMWYVDFEKVGYEPKKSSIQIIDTPGVKSPHMEVYMRKLQGPALTKNIVDDINKNKELVESGKYRKAIGEFKKMLDEYKESQGIGIVNLYIGNCYASLNDYPEAINYFKAALESYPEHKGIINSIGESLMNLKEEEEAVKWFAKLDIDEIRNPDSLYNLGVVNYNRAVYDQAEKYFKKATEVKSDFVDAIYQLGMTYVALNKTGKALENLKKFLELAPDHANAQIAQSILDAYQGQ